MTASRAGRRAEPIPPHRLALVADTHVLSRYALVPPRFRARGHGPSAKWHSYLWECWQDFAARCPPVDALIANGDLVEGESPSPRDAKDALYEDPLMQIDAALETFEPLRLKARHIWITRGSVYHEGKFFEAAERLAMQLGARKWSEQPVRYTGEVLERDFYGIRVNVSHHMTTGALYRGTLADRTALFAAAAEALGKTIRADVIVRAHAHMKHLSRSHQKWVVLQPAWKLVNPYAMRRMEFYRAELLSDIGALVLTVSDHTMGWMEYDYAPCQPDPTLSLIA